MPWRLGCVRAIAADTHGTRSNCNTNRNAITASLMSLPRALEQTKAAGSGGAAAFGAAGHCLKPMLLARRVISKWIALAAFAMAL
jgi:hypothetical protein